MNKIIFTLLTVVLFSCNTNQKTTSANTNSVNVNSLLGCWTDSKEENKQGSNINIYRPCDFKSFPATRFRFKMELKENNKCKYLSSARNDAHRLKEGTWSFDEKDNTLQLFNENKEVIRKFTVVEIEKNLLKVSY